MMKFKLPWTVCRICLRENRRMYSLFQKDEDEEMAIADKLSMFTESKVVPDKTLPQEICQRCLSLLNSAYVFQVQCKKSEFLLQLSVKHKEDKTLDPETVYLTSKSGQIVQVPKGVTVTKNRKKSTEIQMPKESVSPGKKSSVHEESAKIIVNSIIAIPPINLSVQPSADVESTEDITEDEVLTESVPADETLVSISPQKNTLMDSIKTDSPTIDEEDNFYIEEVITELVTEDTSDTKISESLPHSSSPKTKPTTKKKDINIQILRYKKTPEYANTKIFICELCGNRYHNKASFDFHMKIHRNDRPHKCEICNASFIQNSKLTIHMRKHTGERPFVCEYCPRRFTNKEAKMLHERMHTGEKPYECDVCGKKFSYSCVLIRHKVLHTNEEKNFICEPCGKSFRFKYHLSAHLKTSAHQAACV